MHKYKLPVTFNTIRIIPHHQFLMFYDYNLKNHRRKYISKLNILDPRDRQRLFDIRYAQPSLRRRLLSYHCKNRSGVESLSKHTTGQPLAIAEGKDGLIRDVQDVQMDDTGLVSGDESRDDGCTGKTPGQDFSTSLERLEISELEVLHNRSGFTELSENNSPYL